MRVTSVGLYSSLYEEAITFSLRDADPTAQYMVRTIIGIDAEEIIPRFYGFGLQTKSRFYDFGMKARDIVIRVVLKPRFNLDESYSDIRDELYRAISANRTGIVMLHFNSGATTVARIPGFITKFEVPYFSREPEAQITVKCDDPMFRGLNPVLYLPAQLKTTNPVIVADSLSTAPHGFSFQVTFKATTATFTIQDVQTNPDWQFIVTPNGGFLSGDKLYFSSDYSNKYLYMVRGAATTYLVDRINPASIWPVIFPGGNSFHFVNIAQFDWNNLEYYPAYWGV